MSIALPNLVTLATKPSWHNRQGRVDRSAVAEVRAGEVARDLLQRPLPTDPAYAALGRANVVVPAWWVYDKHRGRQPFMLLGDFRSGKSNAMKIHHAATGGRGPGRRSAGLLGPNPNRGGAMTKMLGLPVDWSQRITIERHRLHARLSQHFLVCPVCGCQAATVSRGPGTTVAGSARSTRSPALPGRSLKLYLPLCTEAEVRDAELARLWLGTWQDHPSLNRPAAKPSGERAINIRSALIARYAPLWPPRTLACRKCLGLRYGEVKFSCHVAD